MVSWLISRSGAVSPPSGNLLAAAYVVRLTRGSSTRDVVVEFSDSSAVVSTGYAEEVARPFLRDGEPPQHLFVEASGRVAVHLGPGRPTDEVEPHSPVRTAESRPQRARTHRRGASGL